MSNITEKFQAFHLKYPEVYRELVELAKDAKLHGRSMYGIRPLWEVLRYRILLEPTPRPYKLSDNYPSRYARLIMEREPDLQGFFRTRPLRSL